VIFAVLEWWWPITTTGKGLCRFYLLIVVSVVVLVWCVVHEFKQLHKTTFNLHLTLQIFSISTLDYQQWLVASWQSTTSDSRLSPFSHAVVAIQQVWPQHPRVYFSLTLTSFPVGAYGPLITKASLYCIFGKRLTQVSSRNYTYDTVHSSSALNHQSPCRALIVQ
jgi:hypothetical protein